MKEWSTASHILNLGINGGELPLPCPGQFNPHRGGGGSPGTCWIGSYASPTAGTDAIKKRQISVRVGILSYPSSDTKLYLPSGSLTCYRHRAAHITQIHNFMKSSVFWVIAPYSPLKASSRFEGTG
jgi:hypothetical protein